MLLAFVPATSHARPTTPTEAEALAKNWLSREALPLKSRLSGKISGVQTFKNSGGEAAYHVVAFAPEGFIVIAGDDCIEPIICFSSEGHYDPSQANPMGALVSRDLDARVARVKVRRMLKGNGAVAPAAGEGENAAQAKWTSLLQPRYAKLGNAADALSDLRVAPLLESKWGQTVAGDNQACFNYFTPTSVGQPSNYPVGCVATAMAQLMRYHRYPGAGVGTASFQVSIDGRKKTRKLRGGDGSGGAYNWRAMPLVPSVLTQSQGRMIGSLTYDASVSIRTSFRRSGSGAPMANAADSLQAVFEYCNVIHGLVDEGSMSSRRLQNMINPDLDAGYPVLLAIYKDYDYGHAVVCDGYGYNSSTLYHHLNMGWGGYNDAWYNLPNIDGAIPYNLVTDCIYNVFPHGKGEIISGRVIGPDGAPLAGVTVTARGGGKAFTSTTNARGIYAFVKVPSSTAFTITASRAGYTFASVQRKTGKSASGEGDSGNVWDVRIVAARAEQAVAARAEKAVAARSGKSAVAAAVWRAYE